MLEMKWSWYLPPKGEHDSPYLSLEEKRHLRVRYFNSATEVRVLSSLLVLGWVSDGASPYLAKVRPRYDSMISLLLNLPNKYSSGTGAYWRGAE
jgi:hypothetical protein